MPYSHPRELLDDIKNLDLSEDAQEELIFKRLGIEMPNETEEESDNELRNELEEDELEKQVMAEMIEETRRVVRHPLEYFERMRIKETFEYVRANQLREDALEDDEAGD